MGFKERFRSVCTDKHAIADCLDVTVTTIDHYIAGRAVPRVGNLEKIADYYGVSTDYLLGRTKKAKWEKTTRFLLTANLDDCPNKGIMAVCTNCYIPAPYVFTEPYKTTELFKYCPNCGAKMEEVCGVNDS